MKEAQNINPVVIAEHSALVARLFKNRSEGADGILHAAVGICTEAGEVLDAAKKVWVYNATVNRENVIEELGDLEFYMRALRTQLSITREETLIHNIRKLNQRYPQGYTDEHAALRLDKQQNDA